MATSIRTPGIQHGLHRRQAAPQRQMGTPVIVLALLMALMGVFGVKVLSFTPMGLACIPVIFCAFARPQFFLTLAIAFVPFVYSLSGEVYANSKLAYGGTSGAAYGISDVLLAIALPGLIAKAITHPARMKMGKLRQPVLLYLIVGLISFIFNYPFMHGTGLSYFIAYIRSMQIILILPLAFLAIEWTPDEVRNLFRAYLIGADVLGIAGILYFAAGTRNGLFILGNHKNGTGLALAMGALIAVAALTQPPPAPEEGRAAKPEPLHINRQFILASAVICVLGLLCALSRGSYLCTLVGFFYISIARRRGRIFGTVLVLAIVGMGMLIYLLPEKSVEYVKDYSTQNANNHTRIDQSQEAFKRFQSNYILGDGYRTRKEILPHNLEVTILAETGLLGAVSFLWMLIAQAQIFARARKLFAGDSLREFVVVSTIACSIAVLVQAQFDPYWRRGPLWIPWCGTGLILSLMLQEMQARRAARAAAQAEEDRIWWEQRAERVARRRAEMTAPERDYRGAQPESGGATA